MYTVYKPGDAGYARACATFNTEVVHAPELVLAATGAGDVAAAVRFAREHGHVVHVQATGHGARPPIRSGVLVSTAALDAVSVDPATRVATVAGGARVAAVLAAAAAHGQAPITGSSTHVGLVGYLLAGGLGPLARSHGFSSDHVESFAVVDGRGDPRTASREENPELFWALRGGGPGLGIVTEVRLRLAALRTLYAGALLFDEADIERAFRGWVAWTDEADPHVTSSAAIIQFPRIDAVPAPLRGRRMLALRFAFPGPADEGAHLAAPLRVLAAPAIDAVREMPVTDIAQIHNDPTEPGPAFIRAMLLARADADLASLVLRHAAARSPWIAVELRHLGAATRRDVPGGSAVSGRAAAFTLSLVGRDPALFASVLPEATARLESEIAPWLSPERNLSFMGPPRSPEHFASAWPAATRARLEAVREAVDPEGRFAR